VGPEGGASAGEGACQGGSNGGAETDRGNRGGVKRSTRALTDVSCLKGGPLLLYPNPLAKPQPTRPQTSKRPKP